MNIGMDYQTEARMVVFSYVKARLEKTDTHVKFSQDDVYVVWFTKVLKNWKALVSTTLPDGMYYEVTYDGQVGEIYLDAYKKIDNVVIEVTERPATTNADLPHSRGCTWSRHHHGKQCARDCPTCQGGHKLDYLFPWIDLYAFMNQSPPL